MFRLRNLFSLKSILKPMKTSPITHLLLNQTACDTATGLIGTLTHLYVSHDESVRYIFQPRGLDPETHLPLESIWLTEGRLVHPETRTGNLEFTTTDLPIDAIGTEATDDATTYNGMVVGITLHINGCVHADLQRKGVQKNGSPVKQCEFDVRRLSGESFPKMSKEAIKKSLVENPSPAPLPKGRR